MSHDDFGLPRAVDRLNALAAMLLEAGRSTPAGTLAGPLSRLTSGLKPTASLGMGIAVGSAAVLTISAILKARAATEEGAAAMPAAGGGSATNASAAAGTTAEGRSVGSPIREKAPSAAAALSPAKPRAKRAPRRKGTGKPAGTAG